jgi:hypothetical protein
VELLCQTPVSLLDLEIGSGGRHTKNGKIIDHERAILPGPDHTIYLHTNPRRTNSSSFGEIHRLTRCHPEQSHEKIWSVAIKFSHDGVEGSPCHLRASKEVLRLQVTRLVSIKTSKRPSGSFLLMYFAQDDILKLRFLRYSYRCLMPAQLMSINRMHTHSPFHDSEPFRVDRDQSRDEGIP